MAGKPVAPPRSRSRKPAPERGAQADESTTTGAGDGVVKPKFDVTKVEGFIPIEQFKNGWTLPDDGTCFTTDPNELCPEGKHWYPADGGFVALSPDEERACATIARILYQVTKRQRAEKRAKAEAEAVAAEPKFVRVRRTPAARVKERSRSKRAPEAPGSKKRNRRPSRDTSQPKRAASPTTSHETTRA